MSSTYASDEEEVRKGTMIVHVCVGGYRILYNFGWLALEVKQIFPAHQLHTIEDTY